MISLELLAPAKSLSVGIAAIDCGADAVYIAGPSFGARKDAGNSVEDIAQLCLYAHRYGAKVFAAVNTLVYEEEVEPVRRLALSLQAAGVDALIVQDMSLLALASAASPDVRPALHLPLHASTQCAILDAGRARQLAEAGFSRLILERQLSLEQIREIRRATAGSGVELEFFVHGALCVSYSGQCYLSEALCGRSANRGACVQACRSRYDVYDGQGKRLLHGKAVLSLKDLNLLARLGDLAAEGVTSFKVEGRLKNESYVRNVVTAYSQALDALVAARPDRYERASFGRVLSHFTPDVNRTFNRGYTGLYLDGRKGGWAAMDASKGMGGEAGRVRASGRDFVEVEPFRPEGGVPVVFAPGDGLSFVTRDGEVEGFRVDTVRVSGTAVRLGCRPPVGIGKGARLFRNLDVAFEKILAAKPSQRLLGVEVRWDCRPVAAELAASDVSQTWELELRARSEDGREAVLVRTLSAPLASNAARMRALLETQFSKTSGHYACRLLPVDDASVQALPLLPASTLNEFRRTLCEQIDREACHAKPLHHAHPTGQISCGDHSYKSNLSNSVAASACVPPSPSLEAFELRHQPDAELMRSRYCLRAELGLCPKYAPRGSSRPAASARPEVSASDFAGAHPLFLENNGSRLRLDFDCRRCEMVVRLVRPSE